MPGALSAGAVLMHTPDLFPESKPPRQAPRVLMHFIDVGYIDGLGQAAQFECPRCGYESGWERATDTQIGRGIPCPKCNREPEAGPVISGADRTAGGWIGQP